MSAISGSYRAILFALKIRIIHALVMILCYRRHLSISTNALWMKRVCFEHCTNLSLFVLFYRLFLCGSSRLLSSAGRNRDYQYVIVEEGEMAEDADLFVSDNRLTSIDLNREIYEDNPRVQIANILSSIIGFIGGFFIWGRKQTPLNTQIGLYLFSRVSIGFVYRILLKIIEYFSRNSHGFYDKHFGLIYRTCMGLVWASVMLLHKVDRECLQSGLAESMDILYD